MNGMKLSQYFTAFPSYFNNIFLKSLGLLPNLTRKCEILQKLMIFHGSNDISWNFSGIIPCFHSVAMYFEDFWFSFWYFRKMTAKFWFCSNRLKILKLELLAYKCFAVSDGEKSFTTSTSGRSTSRGRLATRDWWPPGRWQRSLELSRELWTSLARLCSPTPTTWDTWKAKQTNRWLLKMVWKILLLILRQYNNTSVQEHVCTSVQHISITARQYIVQHTSTSEQKYIGTSVCQYSSTSVGLYISMAVQQ